jgi:hypothetical protein
LNVFEKNYPAALLGHADERQYLAQPMSTKCFSVTQRSACHQ